MSGKAVAVLAPLAAVLLTLVLRRRALRRSAAAQSPPTAAPARRRQRHAHHASRATAVPAHVSDGIELQPIGYIRSCFPERRGTPRQGMLVPDAASRLRLLSHVPPGALDGLEGYSHVWLIFVFHDNTRRQSNKPSAGRGKIKPPKAGGMRVGVLATRAPHRPNPIGLTLAQLEKVEDGVLFLRGADLLDGTPVLDIKPYVPTHDSRPHAHMPAWVEAAQERPALPVTFSPLALAQLQQAVQHCRLYSDAATLQRAIAQTLALDIHSGAASAARARRGEAVVRQEFMVRFDTLTLQCEQRAEAGGQAGAVCVVHVSV